MKDDIMKITFLILSYFLLLYTYSFASTSIHCKGKIQIIKTYDITQTRSSRTLVDADILVNKSTFTCKGMDSSIIKDGLNKHASIELGIHKNEYEAKSSYRVDYTYSEYEPYKNQGTTSDESWYITQKLNLKSTTVKQSFTKYTGSLFSVYYPSSFSPRPQKPYSKTYKSVDTDEAFFLSPDKKVEFFVYSPHWSGEPKTYHKVAKNEILIDSDLKETYAKENIRISIRYVTIKAKDNSYTRSYAYRLRCTLDVNGHPGSCESDTFGIKYKDKKTYHKFKKIYIKFKKSLEKYAAS